MSQEALLYMRARVNSGEKEDLCTLWGYSEVTAVTRAVAWTVRLCTIRRELCSRF